MLALLKYFFYVSDFLLCVFFCAVSIFVLRAFRCCVSVLCVCRIVDCLCVKISYFCGCVVRKLLYFFLSVFFVIHV
jgi:hypothetical protein